MTTLEYEGGPSDAAASLAELERLTVTAGGQPVHARRFSRPRPDASLFLGRGQADEIQRLAAAHRAGLLIVDHELKPIQQRNLEEAVGVRVVDRTQLILDIFAQRAKTHEGKLQVELAQLYYLLPRLTGTSDWLSRLGGGIGTKGPGETKLEQDRRQLRRRISVLKEQLEHVRQTRGLHRQDRESVPLPLVSLVGYTNAGKSALLTALTRQPALVADKLFATLDSSTRQMILPPSQEVLLTDTVGFIRRLPHHLVAAFRGTLEEVLSADLLLHVADASLPDWKSQTATVEQVLAELEAREKPCLLVLNKIDCLGQTVRRRLRNQFPKAVQVSALTGEGLAGLRSAVQAEISRDWKTVRLRLGYEQAALRNFLLRRGRLLKEVFAPKGVILHLRLPEKIVGQVEKQNPGVRFSIV